MDERIAALLEQGQSVWQDDISREMIDSGEIQRNIDQGIRGLTSNPTIFEKAIGAGKAYDDTITALTAQGLNKQQIFDIVAVRDIQDACDLFLPIYDTTGGRDGFVSLEVSPGSARDADLTREEARRLWSLVDRPNLMVKIPGTAEGAPVIQEMLTEGININVTLLFSIAAYERVAESYIAALEARQAAGLPIDRIASVASFFVSRVDGIIDAQLDKKIEETGDQSLADLKGKAAIANAKLAYQAFERLFRSDRFAPLAAAGAAVQRPLWASTSVKNPAYRDVLYVEELIGPETVNTMPRPTIQAFIDHGVAARTIDEDLEGAQEVMDRLAAAGIDVNAVTDKLEADGIASFVKSFDGLLESVEMKRTSLAAV